MKETTNREVNTDDVEVLNLDDDVETTDESEDNLDEEVIPAVEDDEPIKKGSHKETKEDTEKEKTETDESTDESSQSDEETQETDDSHSQTKTPAPVEGETPKERALRKEVERLKGLRRTEAIQRLAGNQPEPEKTQTDASVQELRDLGYSDEEIANMEKAIDVIAGRKGYVKASTLNAQSYQQTVNSVTEAFTEAHPEYLPKNDPGDVRWNRFEEILKDGTYNLAGKSPKELTRIFSKVHADVVEELGEPTDTVEQKKEDAQRQKIRSVSHSGGNKSPSVKTPAPKKAADVPSIFKGFTEDDF